VSTQFTHNRLHGIAGIADACRELGRMPGARTHAGSSDACRELGCIETSSLHVVHRHHNIQNIVSQTAGQFRKKSGRSHYWAFQDQGDFRITEKLFWWDASDWDQWDHSSIDFHVKPILKSHLCEPIRDDTACAVGVVLNKWLLDEDCPYPVWNCPYQIECVRMTNIWVEIKPDTHFIRAQGLIEDHPGVQGEPVV